MSFIFLIFFFQSNIALFLHATGEFRHSVRFLEHALALNIKYHGEKSLKVAVSYHLVARTQSCMGDFRSALCSEKETYAIYKQLVSSIKTQCFAYHRFANLHLSILCDYSWAKIMKKQKNHRNVYAI